MIPIDCTSKSDFLSLFALINYKFKNDPDIIWEAARAYIKDDRLSPHIRPLRKLENKWYSSLKGGRADYSVYSEEIYIAELWACWIMYSRKYLKAIQKTNSLDGKRSVVSYVKRSSAIIDLGCGFGLTTSSLSGIFPTHKVYGTNIKDSFQYRIAKQLGGKFNFALVEDLALVPKGCFIFASEYFEHFERPVEHLHEVITKARPKFLLIANTFNGDAIGHFNQYRHKSKILNCAQMNRFFNYSLRYYGYKKVQTKLWNQRPALWVRKHGPKK